MKKLLVIAIVLFTIQITAQDKPQQKINRNTQMAKKTTMSPTDFAEAETKMLARRLDLTQEQETQVKTLILNQLEKSKSELTKVETKKTEENTTQIKLNKDNDFLSKMKQILNDTQYKIYMKYFSK